MVARDNELISAVSRTLSSPEYNIRFAGNVLTGFSLAMADNPEVIIMDRNIPATEYTNFLQWIHKEPGLSNIPVMVLGPSNGIEERIKMLDAGADEYLGTPFEDKELIFRIELLKRRDKLKNVPRIMNAGLIEMNLDSCVVTVGGEAVKLTTKEYELLHELLKAKGRVLSRDYLLEKVWGTNKALDVQTRTVDIHMSRLRTKIGEAGKYIITVRNIGYRIDVVAEWML